MTAAPLNAAMPLIVAYWRHEMSAPRRRSSMTWENPIFEDRFPIAADSFALVKTA